MKKRFKDFTLDVAFSLSSSRTGIFGPSGSGKSTIMNLLAGLALPDSGYIRLGTTVLFDSKEKINLKPDQRGIGVVFQHAHLFPHMSVKKNIFYGYKRIKSENRQIDPAGLFEVLGVTPLLSRDVSTLSGGERQRIALARTVLSNPRLILLDEPLSALDEGHKFQIIPYLKNVFNNYGIPIIFISHSVMEMRMMTDEILVIKGGCIQQHRRTEELMKQPWHRDLESYVNLRKKAMKIIIKEARPVDIDQMLPLLAQLFAIEQDFEFNPGSQARGLRLMLDGCGKHRTVKVAWVNDIIVGMCTAQTRISTALGRITAVVEDLVVDREYRNKGIATLLLSAIEDWALKKGIKSISLLADKDNHNGLDFYNKKAWKQTSLICLVKSLD
nr:GNAT family N-acetyltransferase [Desulfobacter latus]